MVTNRIKVGTVTLMFCAFLFVFFKTRTEVPHIAGFKKADLEQVLYLTGVTYDGTLQDLVKATQKGWLRPAGKERWEIEDQPHEKQRDVLLPLFRNMGLVDAWEAQESSYEHILFMGATVFRMAARMETLHEVLVKLTSYKDIVFLSGCRYLTGDEKEFLIKRGWSPVATTEGGVYPRLFEENKIALDKVIFIDSPETILPSGRVWRPTTADGVKDWLKTNPTPGTALVISSQPFCHYQKVVAESLLPTTFTVQAVGVKAPEDTTVAVYLDTLARTLYQWVTTQKNK
jgi:hypothetical protein